LTGALLLRTRISELLDAAKILTISAAMGWTADSSIGRAALAIGFASDDEGRT